ncbi:CAP domain-containing protein [Nitratifractor sp.]|uniref:CAP domain-containing protein n=1 Tax=Nitratifractor sp. TaxID=2268144 RepID=UPI0025EDFBCB|nr:CAP domain-containing protein [Nitratifractor sp.]
MIKTFITILLLSLGLSAYDQGGVAAVNGVRRSAGMIPLQNNYALSRSAYHHAKYLGRLRRKGHLERPGSAYYTGRTPFDRMVRAGYPSRAGVENISYGDSSYAHSVRILMATLYHRLAFLDFRIDVMGSSEYGNRKGRIYVYDMGASSVAKLCSGGSLSGNGSYVYGICADRSRRIPRSRFQKALRSVERRNAGIVLWPPADARNVPTAFVRETPDPIPGIYHAGYPVTVQFNPAYFHRVKLRRFELFDEKGRAVKARILQAVNDPHHKLLPGDFALIPLGRLAPGRRYRVLFEADVDGKRIQKSWSFQTGK